MGSFVSEEDVPLACVECAEHGRGDEDAARRAGQGERLGTGEAATISSAPAAYAWRGRWSARRASEGVVPPGENSGVPGWTDAR